VNWILVAKLIFSVGIGGVKEADYFHLPSLGGCEGDGSERLHDLDFGAKAGG